MSADKSPIDIAYEAERDLNSHQAKTGAGKANSSDRTGVDASVESKFPGSEVKFGDDLITSASYNRKIPEDEGGDVDARGKLSKGSQFEGKGGPENKAAQRAADKGGENDPDVQQIPGGNQQSKQKSKAQFKGGDYYEQESVPDSISAQGNIAPDSVIESSRAAEQA